MKIKDILGNFSIIGSNQDATDETYKGSLELSLDEENRIIAKWLINKKPGLYSMRDLLNFK